MEWYLNFHIKAVFYSYDKNIILSIIFIFISIFYLLKHRKNIKVTFFHVVRFLFIPRTRSCRNYYCLFHAKILWEEKIYKFSVFFCAIFLWTEHFSLGVAVLYCKVKGNCYPFHLKIYKFTLSVDCFEYETMRKLSILRML